MTDGGLGAVPLASGGCGGLGDEDPRRWAIFVSFWKKKAILMSLDHISHEFTVIWKSKIF